MITTLILPGLGNSGPEHWQTLWEQHDPTFRRVNQDDWDSPRCSDWVMRLNDVVDSLPGQIVFVSHSSACALVAHWTKQASENALKKIRGALLVAPSDPYGPNYPAGPTGFGPVPLIRFPFPSIVVASTDDKYISVEQAHVYAQAWNSRLVIMERAGHINSNSGLGVWPDGLALLNELTVTAI